MGNSQVVNSPGRAPQYQNLPSTTIGEILPQDDHHVELARPTEILRQRSPPPPPPPAHPITVLNEDSESEEEEDFLTEVGGVDPHRLQPIYKGERNARGHKEGQGTLLYPKDDPRARLSYTGQFSRDQRSGRGTLVWKNGAQYVGEWKDDKMHGHGVLLMPSGLKYSGGWKNGCFHDSGTLTWPSGRRYDGGWANNRHHGAGILMYEELDRRGREVYAGEWSEGQRHGQGMMRWRGGSYYTGCWSQGKRNGYGEQHHENGEAFMGQWKNGRRHGRGFKKNNIGTLFIGTWCNDKKEGISTYVFPHGRLEFQHWSRGYVSSTASTPPYVQSLLVLCIEALATDTNLRNKIFKSRGKPHQLVPTELLDHIQWAYEHVILARKQSTSLWQCITQKYTELTIPYLATSSSLPTTSSSSNTNNSLPRPLIALRS